MNLIGRENEKAILSQCLSSGKAEFVVVYGRRRVGKTFLIKSFFKEKFAFYGSGVLGGKRKDKLVAFHQSLRQYGDSDPKAPKNWFEAFSRVQDILESSVAYRERKSGKRVVFLDETPWMDGARSDFKPALDFFWNTYASTKEDIVLIVCGSATSWIVKNILKSEGGFYNRLTHRVHLKPFSLSECKTLAKSLGMDYSPKQLIDAYMVFGGIPHYWSLFNPSKSVAQNIDSLCFDESGELSHEYTSLFKSLFSAKGKHRAIIEVMAAVRKGMTRQELAKAKKIGGGEPLTVALEELEECGFIRRYTAYSKKKYDAIYQLIDPFVRFATTFLLKRSEQSWMEYIGTSSYHSWSGLCFELVVLNNIESLKKVAGFSDVATKEYAWKSKTSKPGAQIDLILDRKDGITFVLEAKYVSGEFEFDAAEEKNMARKIEVFRKETKTVNTLRAMYVTLNGLKKSPKTELAISSILATDLM